MTMAFRLEETSISCADVMYRSRRSFFSSVLVASRSNRACGGLCRRRQMISSLLQTR